MKLIIKDNYNAMSDWAANHIADAINNLSDMGTSLLTLVGFKISGKPADKDHPFGHQRIEYIIGLIIAMFIIFIGFQSVINNIFIYFHLFDVAIF